MPSSSAFNAKNVRHNHTYPLPNGRKSRDELEEDARREKEERATRSRDEKRAKAMKVWNISVNMVILYQLAVEWFFINYSVNAHHIFSLHSCKSTVTEVAGQMC